MLDHKKPDPRGVTVMIRISTLIVISALILGCEEGPTTKTCDGSSVTPINIKFAKNHMAKETIENGVTGIEVKPSKAKSHLGYKLQFHLNGDSKTTVTISGKVSDSYPDSSWIAGVGKGGDHIDVCVPDLDIPEDPGKKTYGYIIDVDGVGILDPEVTIKR